MEGRSPLTETTEEAGKGDAANYWPANYWPVMIADINADVHCILTIHPKWKMAKPFIQVKLGEAN